MDHRFIGTINGPICMRHASPTPPIRPRQKSPRPGAAGQSAVVDNESAKDVVKVAVGSPDHKTLVTAVQTANLVDVLSNAGPFTVFAPTDAAFNALPKGTVEDLLKEKNREKLTDILQYHVAVAGYPAEALTDGRILSMVNGGSATISNKDGVIMINDAKVVGTSKPAMASYTSSTR